MRIRRIDLLEAFIESRNDGDIVFSQDLIDYFKAEKAKYPDRMMNILDIGLRTATVMLKSSERVTVRKLTGQERRTFKRGTTYMFTITKG